MAAKIGTRIFTQNSNFGSLTFNSCILMLIIVIKFGFEGFMRAYRFKYDIKSNVQQSNMTNMGAKIGIPKITQMSDFGTLTFNSDILDYWALLPISYLYLDTL